MISRKILAAGIAALALSSCSTITHTSQTAAVDTQIYNMTVADLNVAAKKDSVTVDWKWNPLSTVSLKAQKETATHTLLGNNGADVLVEPQYIVNRRGIFRGGSVTVTGYPATYSDFRTMTSEDAEKIATLNGNCNTVILSTNATANTIKAKKPQRKTSTLPLRGKNEKTRHKFINVLGGATIDIDGDVDTGYHFGLMYGSYGSSWGWYGKLTMNTAELYVDYQSYDYDEPERKWCPMLTIGAIKTLGAGFNLFAGVGAGGYFVAGSHYWYEQNVDFSIPVELGVMKRFNHVNVMMGATYATPLSNGNGNINPFIGVGYSF